MTASNFDRSFKAVLKHEGGYVDHPRDPGGATNLGITIGTLKAYRGKRVTKADVKNLTVAEAGAIYRKNYWDKVVGDDLPQGVDYAMFDFAVNSGPSRSVKFAQRVVGVTSDGALGPITMKAILGYKPEVLIESLCNRRLAWLKSLGTWGTFGRGWGRRVEGVRKLALQMAGEKPAPVIAKPPEPPPDIEPPLTPPQPASGGFFYAIAAWVARWFSRRS